MTFPPRRPSFEALLRRINRGARVGAILYDLFPLQHPEQFLPEVGTRFVRGLEAQVRLADVFAAISQRTADGMLQYLRELGVNRPVRTAYLGSDVLEDDGAAVSREGVPTLLSVGTCEPRKNYAYAIAICERLWDMGLDLRYVIVGGVEMNWRGIADSIRAHPEFGRRLFLLDQASDRELVHLYRSAHYLLAASIDEGFGLPVMEAWRYGLPVICTDTPIFHELNPDGHFIPLGDVETAATRIAAMFDKVDEAHAAVRAAPRPKALLTWGESAEQLLAALDPAENAAAVPGESEAAKHAEGAKSPMRSGLRALEPEIL
jgi:alpha-1,2-rhamnosyltransferase